MTAAISVPIPALLELEDLALLLMRLIVGAVFVTSGWSHARDPVARGRSIGIPPGFTRALGIAELAGGLGVALGGLTQLAAIGLILVMLGSIQKKILSGGQVSGVSTGPTGWHYDLMLALMCLVIATTGGGRYVLV